MQRLICLVFASVAAEKSCSVIENFCNTALHGESCTPSCGSKGTLFGVADNGVLRCYDGSWSGKPCCGDENSCVLGLEKPAATSQASEDDTDLSFLGYVIPLGLLFLFLLCLCCFRICCNKKQKEKDIEAQETQIVASKPKMEKVVEEPEVAKPVFFENKLDDNSHKSVSVVSSEPPQNWSVPIGPNMEPKAPVAPPKPEAKPHAEVKLVSEVRGDASFKRSVPQNFGRVVRRSSQSPVRRDQVRYVERDVVTAPRFAPTEFNSEFVNAQSTEVRADTLETRFDETRFSNQYESRFPNANANQGKLALGEVIPEQVGFQRFEERIERVGGFMEVETPAERGTRARVEIDERRERLDRGNATRDVPEVSMSPQLGNLGARASEIAPVMV